MNLAKWDGEGRLRLYSYTQEDSFRERVGRFIHDGLQQLWEDDQLFDLEVIIDDKVFRCHKVILSAVSGYFRSLLTLDKHGGDTGVVRLEGGHVTPEAFQGLLELLYDGKDVIQNDTAMDMLKAATFLQMRALEYRCVDIMCRRLTEKSCLKIWEWAENYNCPVLASKAKGVALGKFMVLRHTLEFLQMPLERLTTMLGHEMLNFRYEDDLLESILDWVEYDREDRRQYLKELLPYVCFPYLSTKYLNELRKHELIGVKTEFSNFVDEALTYHLAALQKDGKKIQMEVLRRQAHSLKRLMPGMRRVAVLLGGCVVHGEPLTNVIACYLDLGYPQTREVLTFAIASLPRELGFRFASTVWKHDIYVSGGSRAPGSLMVYKPHENNWHELKGLPVGREDHAMVAVDNKLFLLGGRKVSRQGHELVSEIGVYNIEDGTWEKAGDLLIAVESAPAVSVGGKLYLLGGRNGKGRSVRAVQCLDIESGHVTVAGHLPQPVEGARAVVIGRDIILICPDGPVLKMREDASRGRRVTFAHQDSQEAGHR
nr:hypothetical protein BaRGS_028452 [Batillaria attramentaria]